MEFLERISKIEADVEAWENGGSAVDTVVTDVQTVIHPLNGTVDIPIGGSSDDVQSSVVDGGSAGVVRSFDVAVINDVEDGNNSSDDVQTGTSGTVIVDGQGSGDVIVVDALSGITDGDSAGVVSSGEVNNVASGISDDVVAVGAPSGSVEVNDIVPDVQIHNDDVQTCNHNVNQSGFDVGRSSSDVTVDKEFCFINNCGYEKFKPFYS